MKNKLTIRYFLGLLISTLIMAGFLASGLWSLYLRETTTQETATLQGQLNLVTAGFKRDLQIMGTYAAHIEYELNSETARDDQAFFERTLLALAHENPIIERITIYGTHGEELCRIEKRDGEPFVLPKSANPQTRDLPFLNKGLALKRDEFYFSPIFFDGEKAVGGAGDKPFLRIVFPWLPQGAQTPAGVVVIRMSAERLLSHALEVFSNSPFQGLIVDETGNPVAGAESPGLEGLAKNGFEALFPKAWAFASARDQGLFEGEERSFHFRKVTWSPSERGNNADPDENNHHDLKVPGELLVSYYVVAFKDRETLLGLMRESPYLYTLILILVVAAIVVFSWNGGAMLARRQTTYQDLADSEKQLRQIMDAMVEGLVIFNIQGKIETINRTASKIFGYSQEEATGRHITDLMNKKTTKFFREAFQKYLETGEGELVDQPPQEMVGKTRDGKTVYGEVALTEIKEDQNRFFIASIRDTTETRKLKAQFQILTEEARDIVVLNSKDLNPVYVSPAVERVLGYSQQEYKNKRPFEYVHPDDLPKALEAYKKLMKQKRLGSPIVFRMRKKDGHYIWAETVIRPILNEDGKVESLVSNIRDVTTRVKMEQNLRESQKAEVLGQITSGVAHEFNNLFMAISGGLSLIRDDKNLKKEQKEMVEMVLKSSKRGADLVRDMLSYSKKQVLTPSLIDLKQFLKELLPALRKRARKGVEISLKVPKQSMRIMADPRALETVFINLLTNALDAIGKTGKIEIGLEKRKLPKNKAENLDIRPGTYACIRFVDTGKGIPGEDVVKVFDPFFTTKAVNEGKGLGLSMVYGFARQSGGTVKIESLAGKGTVVTLYLPLEKKK